MVLQHGVDHDKPSRAIDQISDLIGAFRCDLTRDVQAAIHVISSHKPRGRQKVYLKQAPADCCEFMQGARQPDNREVRTLDPVS